MERTTSSDGGRAGCGLVPVDDPDADLGDEPPVESLEVGDGGTGGPCGGSGGGPSAAHEAVGGAWASTSAGWPSRQTHVVVPSHSMLVGR